MSSVNAEILRYVAAEDIWLEYEGMPDYLLNGLQATESSDRALLVDTAIRTHLWDRFDANNEALQGLIPETQLLAKVLGEKKPDVHQVTDGVDTSIAISPVTFMTKGLRFLSSYSKITPEDAASVRFREMILQTAGPTLKGPSKGYLLKLLLEQAPEASSCIEVRREEGRQVGISFLSSNPEDYLNEAKLIGNKTVVHLVHLLQNLSKSQSVTKN